MISKISRLAKISASFSKNRFNCFSTDKNNQLITVATQKPFKNIFLSQKPRILSFLSKVKNLSGLCTLAQIASYTILFIPPLAMMAPKMLTTGALLATIGFLPTFFIKKSSQIDSQNMKDQQNKSKISQFKNSFRQICFGIGTIGIGLSAVPLLHIASTINPMINFSFFTLSSTSFTISWILTQVTSQIQFKNKEENVVQKKEQKTFNLKILAFLTVIMEILLWLFQAAFTILGFFIQFLIGILSAFSP